MSKQVNQRDAEHYISNRQEFTASALEGRVYNAGHGKLDPEETARYDEDLNKTHFWVYSYSTPIAWFHSEKGWYIVGQKFSQTTSKHQNAVRRAVSSELVGAN
jgi:hypothetical protein